MLHELHIIPTNKTPEILLDSKGYIKIKGRAIDESRGGFPEQILNWIDTYLLNPAATTKVVIALEFLNSYNSMVLTSALKKISQLIKQGNELKIQWYYEEDDVDIFERGEYISSTINVPIEFIVADSIADL